MKEKGLKPDLPITRARPPLQFVEDASLIFQFSGRFCNPRRCRRGFATDRGGKMPAYGILTA
jgi:hypothetical protein